MSSTAFEGMQLRGHPTVEAIPLQWICWLSARDHSTKKPWRSWSIPRAPTRGQPNEGHVAWHGADDLADAAKLVRYRRVSCRAEKALGYARRGRN
jgi:hypothetical protein